MDNTATELDWLRWFYNSADFGPADDDVRLMIEEEFVSSTGMQLPDGYRRED